jgi:anti-sigma B factor antagonist
MFEQDKLEIHQRDHEGITVLDLIGHLVIGDGDNALRNKVESLFEDGGRRLILNMAAVVNIDTSGAGALMFLAEKYRSAGGKMVMVQLAHAHGELYEKARLEATIEIYNNELDAVNSFFPERAVTHYDILDYIEHRDHGHEYGKHPAEPEKNT